MQKQGLQTLKLKAQIKKDKCPTYPFHLVYSTYSHQDFSFIAVADIRHQTSLICVYPFNKNSQKQAPINLELTNIMPRRFISVIHISKLTYVPTTSSVSIKNLQIYIGYRSGQLIKVAYQGKDCQVVQKFNRGLKGEGFLSKASSTIFGNDQYYEPYFKASVKTFRADGQIASLRYSYQVGNRLICSVDFRERQQSQFLNLLQKSRIQQQFPSRFDNNTVVQQGNRIYYGCEYFTALKDYQTKTGVFLMKDQANCYDIIDTSQQILVGLGFKQVILVIDANQFSLKRIIKTETPIRQFSVFQKLNQTFLMLFPYENYILIFNYRSSNCCKLIGHKSFVANALFNQQSDRIVTAGMDHRIGVIKLQSIGQQYWIKAQVKSQAVSQIKDSNIPELKFTDVFALNEYNTNNRSVSYYYGYGDIFPLYGCYCFPTYDARIIIYALQ